MICLIKDRKSTSIFSYDVYDARFFSYNFFISLRVFSRTPDPDTVPNTTGLSITPPAIVPDTKRHADDKFIINIFVYIIKIQNRFSSFHIYVSIILINQSEIVIS